MIHRPIRIRIIIRNGGFTRATKTFAHAIILALVAVQLSKASATSSDDPVTRRIARMTLEEKVGQMFVFGFSGKSANPDLSRALALRPGGLIFFRHNISDPTQTRVLTRVIREWALDTGSLKPFLMVDQEGGSVSRLPTSNPAPSPYSLGAAGDVAKAKEVGQITGQILSNLGFDMNLAPVLDIKPKNQASFIGNRSFGSNASTVRDFATNFADGLNQADVIAVAKHFPGHGHVSGDSHKILPQNITSEETLGRNLELTYQKFLSLPFPAVMTAHVAFPNIDRSGVPATFSPTLIQGLLRTKLSFQGVVLTDDIEMLGAAGIGPVGERAVRAIIAGCDLVMVAWTGSAQREAMNAVLKAVHGGRIPETRIDQSLQRILRMKFALLDRKSKQTESIDPARQLKANLTSLKNVTFQIARKNYLKSLGAESIKISKVTKSLKGRIHVLSSDPRFFKRFQAGYNSSESLLFTRLSRKNTSLPTIGPTDTVVFYVTGLGTARMAIGLPNFVRQRTIVVNTTTPDFLNAKHDFLSVIDLNTPFSESGAWLAEHLFAPTRKVAERDKAGSKPLSKN